MKTIYLVLDMQNDLVHVDGPNGKSPLGEQVRARQVLDRTAQALAKARAAGAGVGFVRVGFSPEYQECPKASPVFGGAPKAGLFKLGGFGTEIHPALAQRPGQLHRLLHVAPPPLAVDVISKSEAWFNPAAKAELLPQRDSHGDYS